MGSSRSLLLISSQSHVTLSRAASPRVRLSTADDDVFAEPPVTDDPPAPLPRAAAGACGRKPASFRNGWAAAVAARWCWAQSDCCAGAPVAALRSLPARPPAAAADDSSRASLALMTLST